MSGCLLCIGQEGDEELGRVQVWEDALWRLTTSVSPGDVTAGFSYLEPKRHISHITELEGEEARSFGEVIARVTKALREAAGADLIYVYIFGGGIPHLHLHLAPHRDGDALNDQMIRGEVALQRLESGATLLVSKDFPALPVEELRAVADRARDLLRSDG